METESNRTKQINAWTQTAVCPEKGWGKAGEGKGGQIFGEGRRLDSGW